MSMYFLDDVLVPSRRRRPLSPGMRGFTAPKRGVIAPVTPYPNPYYPPRNNVSAPNDPTPDTGMTLNARLAVPQQTPAPRIPNTNIAPDYSSDPILARIRALGQQNIQNARAEASALRKQALIDVGDESVAQGLVGQGLVDENTLEAVRAANRGGLSARSRFLDEARLREDELEEALNQSNLFYSGARAERLSDLDLARRQGESDLSRQLSDVLGGITGQLAAAEAAAAAEEQAALEAAAERARMEDYQRSLIEALANPTPVSPPVNETTTDAVETVPSLIGSLGQEAISSVGPTSLVPLPTPETVAPVGLVTYPEVGLVSAPTQEELERELIRRALLGGGLSAF